MLNWSKALNFVPAKGELIVYDTDSAEVVANGYDVIAAYDNTVALFNSGNGYVQLERLNELLNVELGDTLHFENITDGTLNGCLIYNAKALSDKMDRMGTVTQEGGRRVVTLNGDNSSLTGVTMRVADNSLSMEGYDVGIHSETYIHLEAPTLNVFSEFINLHQSISGDGKVTITGVADPTDDDHAVNKKYVDKAKEYICLQDTNTGEVYKLSVTNGKLTAEVIS